MTRALGMYPPQRFSQAAGQEIAWACATKSMFRMCAESSSSSDVGRFAVAQFGHKVSHGPLWILTEALLALASRKHGIDMAAFVNDMLSVIQAALHEACKGPKGNCRTCLDAHHVAVEKMAILDKLMKECGLNYLDKGDMTIRQDHVFIGIIFDTLLGKLLITLDKFAKTMQLLHEVMHQAEISPRGMAKLCWKFGHQFRCIEGVAPLLVPFNRFIGCPDSVREWDEDKSPSPNTYATSWTSCTDGCRFCNLKGPKCGP